VLSASLRNIVEKVSKGGTLNAGEMKLFEQFTLAQASLLKTRQAALVRRWVGGGRLTPEERSEIADVIPASLEQPGAASIQDAPPEAPAKPHKYKRQMVFYGEQYGSTGRTVKRWVKIGKNATHEGQPRPDLPPLDEPEEMATWWARNMVQRPPLKLLAFAAKPAEIVPPAAGDLPQSPAPPSMSHSTPGAIGMLASLERLRLAEEKAGRAYADALAEDPPDVGKIEIKQRAWERLSEALRKAEKDAGKILIDSGEMMATNEVRQVVGEIFGPLFQTWRQFVRRVRPLLSGKTPGDQDSIWDAESDRQFRQFQNHSFFQA
jgi:hypothetical protein